MRARLGPALPRCVSSREHTEAGAQSDWVGKLKPRSQFHIQSCGVPSSCHHVIREPRYIWLVLISIIVLRLCNCSRNQTFLNYSPAAPVSQSVSQYSQPAVQCLQLNITWLGTTTTTTTTSREDNNGNNIRSWPLLVIAAIFVQLF